MHGTASAFKPGLAVAAMLAVFATDLGATRWTEPGSVKRRCTRRESADTMPLRGCRSKRARIL